MNRSRPFGTLSTMRSYPTLKRWAILMNVPPGQGGSCQSSVGDLYCGRETPRSNEQGTSYFLRPMESYDVAIIGGALSGSATALLLLRERPELKVLILEKSTSS